MMNNNLLRLEGFFLLSIAVGIYVYSGFSWIFFAMIFFMPDVALFIYFMDRKAGDIAYALTHNTALPAAVFLISMFLSLPVGYTVAVALLARVGVDRMLGAMHRPPFNLNQYPSDRIAVPLTPETIRMSPEHTTTAATTDQITNHTDAKPPTNKIYTLEDYKRIRQS